MNDRSKNSGFWAGMPTDMKGRAVAWVVYYLIAAVIFSQNSILGIVLLVLPSFWYVGKNLLLGELALTTDLERKSTLGGYTVSHLWNSSIYVRAVMLVCAALLVMFSLGWISTEDLRAEAAKPTISERVVDATGSAVESTKEKSAGWAATAKGWFTKEDHSP